MKKQVQSLLARMPLIYPITATWVIGVLALVAVSAKWVNLVTGIGGFGFASVMLLLAITHRQLTVVHNDIGVVHELVNSQRTAMVARVNQLTAALVVAGVPIPLDPELAKATAQMREDERNRRGRRS